MYSCFSAYASASTEKYEIVCKKPEYVENIIELRVQHGEEYAQEAINGYFKINACRKDARLVTEKEKHRFKLYKIHGSVLYGYTRRILNGQAVYVYLRKVHLSPSIQGSI